MQTDKTMLSLRPRGGSRGGSRVFCPRFKAAAANSDLPVLRPHGGAGSPSLKTGESRFEGREGIRYAREQLLQLREVVNISEEILKAKQEVEAEFSGIDPSWGLGESNVLPNQAQGPYSETDNHDSEGAHVTLSPVAEPPRSDKGKSSQIAASIDDVLELSNLTDNDADDVMRSIRDLFASLERVRRRPRPAPFSSPSTPSTAFSDEDTKALKQLMFKYVAFMDIDINHASAAKHKDKFEQLSAKLVQTLASPSLNIPAELRAKLNVIYSDVLSLLAKNADLRVKRVQYLRAMSEKERLFSEIDKAESELKEISSDIMIEDSLMTSLMAEMKEIQTKMNDCRARMAAKKCNAVRGVERTKSLAEQCSKLEVDDYVTVELNAVSSQQSEDWKRMRERVRSAWGEI